MKKSILFCIIGVFCFATVVITIFGIAPDTYNEKVYVTEIQILNEELDTTVINQIEEDIISLDFDIDNKEGTVFMFNLKILPLDASNKTFKLIYDTNTDDIVAKTIGGKYTGAIQFKAVKSYWVTISMMDGSEITRKVLFDIHMPHS